MDHPSPSAVERFLDALALAWQRRHEPNSALRKLTLWGRRLLIAVNLAHFIFLLLVFVLTAAIGERHYLTAFFLFIPPQAWLLPLAVLTPLTWIFCRRWLLLHCGLVLWVAFGWLGFQWNSRPVAQGPVLRVMTNNYGQNNRQSFTAFLQEHQPEVVVLQEAIGQMGRLLRAYTNYQGRAFGEFVLLSRHPIINAGPLPVYDAHGWPVGAWFELSVQSRTVVVYNVHLPSPRRELYRLRGLGMLAALVGETMDDGRSSRFQEDISKAWQDRAELASRLLAHLEKEKRPFIVAGDFNMPSRGWLHRQFQNRFADAFIEAGRGYGLTFPGASSNPLTGFGPWLRLDYIFCSSSFRPIKCETERGRRSQHRAVFAELEWSGGA